MYSLLKQPEPEARGLALSSELFITGSLNTFAQDVYKRQLYMYTALAPIPLSSCAGEPTSNVGKLSLIHISPKPEVHSLCRRRNICRKKSLPLW